MFQTCFYANLNLKQEKCPKSSDFFFFFPLSGTTIKFQLLLKGIGGSLRSSKNPLGSERNYLFRNVRMLISTPFFVCG